MPPRKKQKPAPAPLSEDPVPALKSGPRPPQTTTGIFTLPLELLWLISTYFGPSVEVPHVELRSGVDPVLDAKYRERTVTLRAIAYTCDWLRQFYQPLLWESWNVCVEPVERAAFYKALGDQLQKASLALVRQPETLSLIRIVNVVLTRYSSAEVLPPFARCISQMPNLHTLQIIHAHTQMTSHLKDGFAGISLPTIQRIVLPGHAHEILRCCPEVREVICTSSDASKLISAIAKCCKKVETIEGFWLGEPSLLKRLVKAAANVLEIRLNMRDDITALSSFKKLKRIQFIHHVTLDEMEAGAATRIPPTLVQPLEVARTLLRQQPATDRRLSIRYTYDRPRDFHIPAVWMKWDAIRDTPFPVKEIPIFSLVHGLAETYHDETGICGS
ncbi:hypothetical protein C8F01DRAFT_1123058 [Mycena amicta]|nr:hypothetical protein C8F01DRAFT_1123058 [Mycena amicta]